MLHAVGQGAIAIETRSGDIRMREMVSKLNHLETDWQTSCERMLLSVLEGGCSVPVGVETCFLSSNSLDMTEKVPPSRLRPLRLHAIIASLDGTRAIEHIVTRPVSSKDEAQSLGRDVALVLIERGGKTILEELGRIVEQKSVKGVNDQIATHQKEMQVIGQTDTEV